MGRMSRPPVIDAEYEVVWEPQPARRRAPGGRAVSNGARPFLELFIYAAMLALMQAILRSLPPPR
jgi:hypothetical protein